MKYYLVHFYTDKNSLNQLLGYSLLANKYTFETFYSSLEKAMEANISFIPNQNSIDYVEGQYFYNHEVMKFGLQLDEENSYILINVGSLDNVNLVSFKENNDLNRTQSIIDNLDKDRIKEIMKR